MFEYSVWPETIFIPVHDLIVKIMYNNSFLEFSVISLVMLIVLVKISEMFRARNRAQCDPILWTTISSESRTFLELTKKQI